MHDDAGSSPVEFLLVGLVLTALTLGVLQLGLAVYLRNVIHDAAVDGAFHGALADAETAEGAAWTRAIIERTIGEGFVQAIRVRESGPTAAATVEVTVVATLPLVGLWGLPEAWEVTAHAPAERLE